MAARRSPSKKGAKASGARRVKRRWLVVGAVLAAVAGAVLVVTNIDFGTAVREVTLPLRHDDIIRQQAKEKNVDAALIAAVIYEESRFRDQTSHAGARGLMQITPDTADVIARISGAETFVTDDLSNPDVNIRYGSFYLRHLLDRYENNVAAALAAYNAGPGNADRWGGSDINRRRIDFPETRHYVRNVLQRQREYRDNYAEELGL